MTKIIKYDSIKQLLPTLKNQKIVLVGGCFDIIHVGHIRFLKKAKEKGNILIVSLESDENVTLLKGKSRPIQKQPERAEVLAELESVDFVLLLPTMNRNTDYEEMVTKISPDIIALTEGDKYFNLKDNQAKKVGAHIAIIPKIETHSSSDLSKIIGLD